MIRSLIFLYLIALMVPSLANANDLPEWYKTVLKQESPNTLSYAVVGGLDQCRTQKSEIESLIEGVLIRSRIKPSTDLSNPLVLIAKIRCAGLSSNGVDLGAAFDIRVAFSRFQPLPVVDYFISYGSIGTWGGEDNFFKDSVKQFVEEAVTDYVTVNFLE
ncbi:hypothetical protein [Marinobacter sp. F3R08]|uniref:hypothetical protein n=1 Tax=Marinobacter sp. F3R08 TaxID=2841559 RepID=UPI001C0A5D11|nr:hypothetical protein [Marinobacter sp. F3R08]MBU2955071.1 hypothetical protein [Marinobacter sp. F3R08]